MATSACVLLLGIFFVTGANCGSYLVTAPSAVQPGSLYDVSVDILNATGVTVEATLQNWVYNGTIRDFDVNVVDTVSGTFDAGPTGILSIPLDPSTRCDDCRLKIRGRGGLQFEKTVHVAVSRTIVVILIQTDKAIYKPGQTVRFRATAVYPTLQMYGGELNIEIMDPNANKIKVLPRQSAGPYGVVEGSLELSDQPQFGDWSIRVVAQDTLDAHTQRFTVADYELPRFEITVELPPFGLKSESSLNGKVIAKYTFGEEVKGRVELHVGPDVRPDQCGNGPRTTQISFDIDGSEDFKIPMEDLLRAVSFYEGTRVRVTAFVTEAATGVRLNGTSVITYYNKNSKLKFLDNTPGVFKPGLPYTAYIQATTPDGKSPPTGSDQLLSVYTTVRYEITVPDQALYGTHRFEGSFPLPGVNITLPASGVVPISIDIPNNATSIEIKATFRGVTDTKTVEKTWSQSNNFLRLTLLDGNVQAGGQVSVKVEGTESLNTINYEVIARGSKVSADTVSANGSRSVTFDLPVSSNMAPVAHVLAYYSRGEDEIVADSIAFDVEGLFMNEVSVRFSTNQSEPHQPVDVLLTADPMSMVNVLAVDQSVLLLKSGNDITPAKVSKAVSKFDRSSKKPSSPEYALAHSSVSVKDVFEDTGLIVISDVEMEKPYENDFYMAMEDNWAMEADSTSFRMGAPAMASRGRNKARPMGRGGSALQQVERVRQVFPEAWLWARAETDTNGSAIMTTTVPDTITSWVLSAFATNPNSGLGVAPTTSKLRVFRPFFVSLTYPGSVTRGEQVVVQATVFNYLPSDVSVTVMLKGNANFQSIVRDAAGAESLVAGDREVVVNVVSGEQGVVYFPIEASTIGLLEVEVLARSDLAADGVRRFISVEAEGAPVSYSSPIFINIDGSNAFMDSLNFTLPPSTVQGSETAKVKVTGDLIGPSLSGLESLLQLPTGCGEQSMVKFAPDLYIAQYLKASGQLTDAVESQIEHYLATGYQRQLTYERYDNSFSAFGNNDPSGSTWLTAMVAGTFQEAREFTFIDPSVITLAVDWLVDRQEKDGSFASFGKVLDPNTQVARTAEGLTAYVVTALSKMLQEGDPVSENRYRHESWTNATRRAVNLLQNKVSANAITDPLSLAMVSYALSLVDSPQAGPAIDQLVALSKTDGGLTYWDGNNNSSSSSSGSISNKPSASQFIIWRPPVVQARPVNILTTSYAVLAMTAAGKIQDAFPSVQWLAAQRNPNGGFASTQDTIVGLQALAAYAMASTRPDTNLSVTVSDSAGAESAQFAVTTANAWTLQIQELNQFPTETNVQATGAGFALLEMVYSFNVNDELSTPSFDVSTVLLDDDIDSFNLMVCTKWLWERDTGMVVQEVGIPSGFSPDLSTLGDVAGLERSERRGNTVAVYFDKISKSSLCYSLVMTRTSKVAKSQRNFVRTFDYYQPSDQSTVFYHPRKLRDSTICDVCDGCCN